MRDHELSECSFRKKGDGMGENSIKKRRSRLRLQPKMLLVVLSIAIVSGLGPATRANTGKSSKQGKMSSGKLCIFNPFRCKAVYVPYSPRNNRWMGSFGKGCKKINCFPKCPPVIPPCKPRCRTPFKVPWWWNCHRRPHYRPWSFGRHASWPGCHW